MKVTRDNWGLMKGRGRRGMLLTPSTRDSDVVGVVKEIWRGVEDTGGFSAKRSY